VKASKPKKRSRRSGRGKLTKLSGRERSRAAFANPKLVGADKVIADAIAWVYRHYNAARKRQGLRALPDSQRARYREKWKEVARYVLENDIEIDAFFDYAYERTRWQKTAFPAVSVLAGPWLRGEWESRDEKRKSRLAGHSYTEVGKDDLREQLGKAGFDVADFSDDDIIFVAEQGELLRVHPEHYSPEDEDLHPLVEWVAENDTN